MNKFFTYTTLFLLLTTSNIFAQNVSELDRRKGFQDIKMASSIKEYEGLEYKKDVEHEIFPEAQLYTAKKGNYEEIGDIKIFDLEVLVYRDSIFQVKVVTEKSPLLYKGLKTAFGEPEFSMRTGKSQWDGNLVRLVYDDHSKRKMEMIYFSYEMVTKLKDDKKEEVKKMSEEF